jgi:hypothetical protein
MLLRTFAILSVLGLAVRETTADEVLYRYEGDVVPYDKSAGWEIFNPCEPPCTESVESGRFVLRWPQPANIANYNLWLAQAPKQPPPTLWVEWRFRSNHPIGPNFFTCDASLVVFYRSMLEVVYMYGDAAISFSGDRFITGLDIEQFHTFRFESLDGIHYRISADGEVFIVDFENNPNANHAIQLAGIGSCELFLNTVNEWDFVRYGTISYGEQIIASDPPGGLVELAVGSTLDRFTVTFDSPNYVYIDEITVETTGADPPQVIQTRRRENDEPHTVEIVLDRPMPLGRTTRFTFDDGATVNVVEYTVTELVPAVSQWGLVVLALLTLIAGTILCRRRVAVAGPR